MSGSKSVSKLVIVNTLPVIACRPIVQDSFNKWINVQAIHNSIPIHVTIEFYGYPIEQGFISVSIMESHHEVVKVQAIYSAVQVTVAFPLHSHNGGHYRIGQCASVRVVVALPPIGFLSAPQHHADILDTDLTQARVMCWARTKLQLETADLVRTLGPL